MRYLPTPDAGTTAVPETPKLDDQANVISTMIG